LKHRTAAVIGILTLTVACAGAATAGGNHRHQTGTARVEKEQTAWGIAGDRQRARTIELTMTDEMRFVPDRVEVREGETVRFVVRNKGGLLHEMVLGTSLSLDEHAALMLKFPAMEHDEQHMTHVKPGARQEIVWNFNRPGEFHYACLIAGHYQAGMAGIVSVTPAATSNERKKS